MYKGNRITWPLTIIPQSLRAPRNAPAKKHHFLFSIRIDYLVVASSIHISCSLRSTIHLLNISFLKFITVQMCLLTWYEIGNISYPKYLYQLLNFITLSHYNKIGLRSSSKLLYKPLVNLMGYLIWFFMARIMLKSVHTTEFRFKFSQYKALKDARKCRNYKTHVHYKVI